MHVHAASSGLPEAHPNPSLARGADLRGTWQTRTVPQAPVCVAHLLTKCLIPRLGSQGQASSACSSPPPPKTSGPAYRHMVRPSPRHPHSTLI